jgi:hypothetical protein
VTGTGLATSIFMWRINKDGDFMSAFHFTQYIAGSVSACAMVLALSFRRPKIVEEKL